MPLVPICPKIVHNRNRRVHKLGGPQAEPSTQLCQTGHTRMNNQRAE